MSTTRLTVTTDGITAERLRELAAAKHARLCAAGLSPTVADRLATPHGVGREALASIVESMWDEEIGATIVSRATISDREQVVRQLDDSAVNAWDREAGAGLLPDIPPEMEAAIRSMPAQALRELSPAAQANLAKLQAALPGLRPEELGGVAPPAGAPSALGGDYADPPGCSHRETEPGPAATAAAVPTPEDIEATVNKAKAARGKLGAERP